MSHLDIIRAWKDEEYRLSLNEAERALLPENPAGLIELTDADLDATTGGLPRRTNCGGDSCSVLTPDTHWWCCGA
jgi:mersacidin/lichenicidin family type 2 lantibiotic